MTTVQKVIKYLALAFAMFLCVSIIGGIITGLTGLSLLLSDKDGEPAGDMQVYPIDGEVSSLSLELGSAELTIKTADKFSVESNHEYIAVQLKDGRLRISETKKLFAIATKGAAVVLTVPEDIVFDEVTVETGAGAVTIDSLSADVLKLSLGAGEAKIRNLTANTRADIDGGAGALTIDGGRLCNLELDMGVGKLTLKSRIEGDSSLDYGIGETLLTLLGNLDDYRIELDKGVGEATFCGESVRDDTIFGAGNNRIDIDGGVGAVRIDFAPEDAA